ncbi:hypothetical protein BCY91_13205 [Pelobium manganitolerans]|uniref:Uncharacterized protein n=1 Tax=Pelobium manganitolerans TaxID=1842495 RepID=A0A419SAQ5_9SPHI|nr:hypothetical protein [Pelobium manganitolerans]RKD19553.1 hypothetical protein BCY91_13205 [Pelobium manganitolerans]
MTRNYLYLATLSFAMLAASACNNEKKTEDHRDTVVVEKETTQDSPTPSHNAATEPATNVTVDKNGAKVETKNTGVSVSKDSVAFKTR